MIAMLREWIAFPMAMLQQHRDRRCRRHDHYWKKERVRYGDDISRMVLHRCTNCGVNYTGWEPLEDDDPIVL